MEQFSPIDVSFMELAMAMAKLGWGSTNPNPLVGAVVVKDDKVISRGYHKGPGEMHAEIEALFDLGDEAKGATLYVNMEPCCHFGRTPPCVTTIIDKGIKRVFVSMKDPNPKVNGKGIQALREAGIEVIVGVLEEEAFKLNEIFVKYITNEMPFVLLKSAMTLDGKTACASGDSMWVSSEESRHEAQFLRRRVSAIMVGINTVIYDNPRLTVRVPREETRNPIRIVVDSTGRIPLDSFLVETANELPTMLATTELIDSDKESSLLDKGVILLKLSSVDGRVNLKELMRNLHSMELDSIMIEGGSELNASAIKEGIVDKLVFYIAPKIIGGMNALTPVGGIGIETMKDAIFVNSMSVRKIGQDICVEGYLNDKLNRNYL